MIRIAFLLIGMLSLSGCNTSDSSGGKEIIPPKQMQSVLLDFIKADAYDTELSFKNKDFKDTADNLRRQEAIFKQHKVNRTSFLKSLDFYKKNPERFIPILDSMLTQQDKTKKIDLLNFNLQ